MGPKLAPKCSHCQTGTSEKWHTVEKGVTLCSPCHEKQEKEQLELEKELQEIQAAPIKTVPESTVTEGSAAAAPPDVGKEQTEDVKVEESKESGTDEIKDEPVDERDEKDSNADAKEKPLPSLSPRKLRKNVRSARKGGTGGSSGNGGKGGRSRRFIFKKNPMKAPTITVTTRTVDTLFHNVSFKAPVFRLNCFDRLFDFLSEHLLPDRRHRIADGRQG